MKELNRLLEDKSGDGEISFEASELHVNSDCDCCMEPTEKKMMVVYQGKWQWGFSIDKTTQRFILKNLEKVVELKVRERSHRNKGGFGRE